MTQYTKVQPRAVLRHIVSTFIISDIRSHAFLVYIRSDSIFQVFVLHKLHNIICMMYAVAHLSGNPMINCYKTRCFPAIMYR
jgi:hypothetical protein